MVRLKKLLTPAFTLQASLTTTTLSTTSTASKNCRSRHLRQPKYAIHKLRRTRMGLIFSRLVDIMSGLRVRSKESTAQLTILLITTMPPAACSVICALCRSSTLNYALLLRTYGLVYMHDPSADQHTPPIHAHLHVCRLIYSCRILVRPFVSRRDICISTS